MSRTADWWHKRLGYLSQEAITHLPEVSTGVYITDLEPVKKSVNSRERTGEPKERCETCEISKSTKITSRRTPPKKATRPFERLLADLIQEDGAYNSDRWCAHLMCEYLGLHIIITGFNKNVINEAILWSIKWIEKAFGYKVVYIRIDNK